MELNTESNLFELQVDHNASAYLRETARWAKFLAILGFICSGILILVALFAGSLIASLSGGFGGTPYMAGMVSFLYIVIALIMFFPNLYLFNFASRMQVALRNNDQEQLTRSFGSLKACYRFIGILMIVYLGIMVLALIFGILGRAH